MYTIYIYKYKTYTNIAPIVACGIHGSRENFKISSSTTVPGLGSDVKKLSSSISMLY
jgi:hypothetical protein